MYIGVIQLNVFEHSRIAGFDIILDLEKYIPSIVFANGSQVVIALRRDTNDPRQLVDDFSMIFHGLDFLTNILFGLFVPWRQLRYLLAYPRLYSRAVNVQFGWVRRPYGIVNKCDRR
jgi:hypothetical protein